MANACDRSTAHRPADALDAVRKQMDCPDMWSACLSLHRHRPYVTSLRLVISSPATKKATT